MLVRALGKFKLFWFLCVGFVRLENQMYLNVFRLDDILFVSRI